MNTTFSVAAGRCQWPCSRAAVLRQPLCADLPSSAARVIVVPLQSIGVAREPRRVVLLRQLQEHHQHRQDARMDHQESKPKQKQKVKGEQKTVRSSLSSSATSVLLSLSRSPSPRSRPRAPLRLPLSFLTHLLRSSPLPTHRIAVTHSTLLDCTLSFLSLSLSLFSPLSAISPPAPIRTACANDAPPGLRDIDKSSDHSRPTYKLPSFKTLSHALLDRQSKLKT